MDMSSRNERRFDREASLAFRADDPGKRVDARAAKREGLSWIDATGDDKTYYRYLTDWKPLDRIKDQSHGG